MSHLWREQLRVALCPDQVALLHLGRGGRRARQGRIVPCQPAAPDEAIWVPALRTLQAILPDYARSGADVSLVLSNHFVRYLLLPWSDKLGSEAEEQAYGRYGFTQVYGAPAAGWSVRLSGNSGGEPWLASAVDTELVTGLEQTVAAAGLGLSTIQPYLAAALNRWHRHLRGDSAWFVLAERGRVCIAGLCKGGWHDLACHPMAADGLAELPDLLERQQLLADAEADPGPVYVCAAAMATSGRPEVAGLKWLPTDRIPSMPDQTSGPIQMAWQGPGSIKAVVDLDYRSHNPRPARPAWAALLLTGLVSGLLFVHYRDLAAETVARQDELDRLSVRNSGGQIARSPTEARQLDIELGQARDVMGQLAFPWETLFAAVEASASDDVALLGVEPELKRGQVGIVGEAKDYAAVLAYIRRLQTTAAFDQVYLQNHQVQAQDREHPVRFTLAAAWRGR